MGLDPLNVGSEVIVEVELVFVLTFVLLGPCLFVAFSNLLLLLFFQSRLRHRGLDSHVTVFTPDMRTGSKN